MPHAGQGLSLLTGLYDVRTCIRYATRLSNCIYKRGLRVHEFLARKIKDAMQSQISHYQRPTVARAFICQHNNSNMQKFLVPRIPFAAVAATTAEERAVAAEAKRQTSDRRLAAMSFFSTFLRIPKKRSVGRPSAASEARDELRDKMVAQAEADTALIPTAIMEWWNVVRTEAAVAALLNKCQLEPVGASEPASGADGTEASAVAASGGGAVPGIDHDTESHGYRIPEIRTMFKACMHVWASDGSHMAWRTYDQFCDEVRARFDHDPPPRSTAFRWIAREKSLFERDPAVWTETGEQALYHAPDLIKLVADINRVQSAAAEHSTVLPADHSFFAAEWRSELVKIVTPHLDMPGFGVHVVAAAAQEVLMSKLNTSEAATWLPSEDWCYRFMKVDMGLVMRRITSAAVTPVDAARQDELHDINLQRIALALANGLEPKYLLAADEFGSHLFPQGEHEY